LIFAFRDLVSEVDCYIGAYSGIGHCLLDQTIGNLFSVHSLMKRGLYWRFTAIVSLSQGLIVFSHPIFAQLEAGIFHMPSSILCGL
jgi:hypothetical protein